VDEYIKPLDGGEPVPADVHAGGGAVPPHGRAVQVDPIKPSLKASGPKRLKLEYDKMLSTFAFKFNLRRYIMNANSADAGVVIGALSGTALTALMEGLGRFNFDVSGSTGFTDRSQAGVVQDDMCTRVAISALVPALVCEITVGIMSYCKQYLARLAIGQKSNTCFGNLPKKSLT
jgi:hypothetical protein